VKSKEKDNGFRFICIPSTTGPLIIPYKLERSRRVKRMHLQINCAQFVILKMPLRQSEVQGTNFLQEHGEWIRQTLAKQPRVPKLRDYLMRHPRISISGRWYRLVMRFQHGTCSYLIDDKRRCVEATLNPRLPAEQQLISILREIGREYLPDRLQYWAQRIGSKVHGITIRDQKCRWGSCSETGGISLNWRLVLISPKLQDHVILHELAHLRYFDHSNAFYRLLRSLDPRADEHERQLDQEASRVIYLGRVES
jgi:predicted metal-dependent hydrolase